MRLEYIHLNIHNYLNPSLDEIKVIGNQIELMQKTYIVNEYTYQNRICSIGVQCNNSIARAYLATKQHDSLRYLRPLYFSKESGLWYDRGTFEENEGKFDSLDSPLGINQCGTYFIVGLDETDLVIEVSNPIKVIPSLIAIDEFNTMLDEISTIGDWLLHHVKEEKSLHEDEWEVNQAAQVTNQLEKLSQFLYEINKKPSEQLIQGRERTPFRQVKRMDSRLLIEREMLPFQEMVFAPVTQASLNIYEHRAIRGALELLHEKWKSRLNIANQKLRNLNESLLDLPMHPVIPDGPINREQQFIAEQTPISIAAKRKSIEKSISVYQSSAISWLKAVNKVEELLELTYLLNLPYTEELYPSHLFEMDVNYADVYDLLVSLLQYHHEPWVLQFHDALKKTPDLYETWSFLKICSLLIKEGGFHLVENVSTKLQEHVRTYTNERPSLLSGISFRFVRPIYSFRKQNNKYQDIQGNMNLTIHFDENVQDLNGKLLRPDIRLDFSAGLNWRKTVYLDMKYKPLHFIEKDIQQVAFQKYYVRMNKEPFASFIIHPNTLGTNWSWSNRQEENNTNSHTFGAFSLRPSDTRQWTTFMTMLFHYRFNFWLTCSSCGSQVFSSYQRELTEGGFDKYYITCTNPQCRLFYVRSHCYRCHKHLCKYPPHSSLNYHHVRGRAWYVSCPNGCN
jgi:hypothetical protein